MSDRAPTFRKQANPRLIRAFWLLPGLALLLFILIRTAWVCDDAYITFRTIDNFISGHGLTWNTAERVQTYTHPLWMLLLSSFNSFIPDIYSISIICSIVLSLAAAGIVAGRTARSSSSALIVLAAMISSRAFIDYSTSGLENPLSHFILSLFLLVYFRESGRQLTAAHPFVPGERCRSYPAGFRASRPSAAHYGSLKVSLEEGDGSSFDWFYPGAGVGAVFIVLLRVPVP